MIYLKAMGFVACVAGMALTACQPYQPSLYNAANHDPRVAHPLNVEPGRADAVIRFVADSAVLELAQATKLASFVDNFLSHGHGSLNVTIVEDGSPRQTLVARARVIGRLAGQRGLPAGALVVGYGAAGQAGDAALPTALLRYDRFVVKLPTCPDWSGAANRRALNQNHSNFGCATQSMFGAMVSDPADLVRQRRAGKSDSERLHRVIRRFRDGTPTGGGGGSTGAAPSTGGG